MNPTIRLIMDLIMKIFGFKSQDKKATNPVIQPEKAPVVNTPVKPTPAPPPPPVIEKPLAPVMTISPEMMKQSLMLGHHDDSLSAAEMEETLKLYHKSMTGIPDSIRLHKMRNGDIFDWVDLKPLPGNTVKTLQAFLINAGIMHPDIRLDGNFDYDTQAGVRMFQEYVRIYEGKKIVPSGIVDEATWTLMKEWQEQKKTAENWPRGKQSEEYKKWLTMIKKAQEHYQNNQHTINKKVNEMIEKLNKNPSIQPLDTFPVGQWTYNEKGEDDIHLIGIRRKEDASGTGRKNDDVFILLINGMVFKFWGSTDPKQTTDARQDEAFLSEGQHKFRFGWHNRVSHVDKLYQGLNPYNHGVLVFRDDKSRNDNRLTDTDIEKGIDSEPNQSINIHWTGIGNGQSGTWSAGCQVIAGKSYIDPLGIKRDCSDFAASGSGDLQHKKENKIVKTKGAYNVFTDLLLLYPHKRVDYLIYTLGRDETLGADFLAGMDGDKLLASALQDFDLSGGETNLA